jgi:L-aspartate oxidase
MSRLAHDGVLVVGAGLAGLSAALAAAPRKVLVLTDAPLSQGCSSAWAQGGMAAALSDNDSAERHAADTVAAGAGLVDTAMARRLTEEGPAAVRALADLGAPFDRTADGAFTQGLEAAHSRPRVARVKGDQAGAAIMAAVIAAVLAAPHIEVRVGHRLRGLLQDAEGRVRGVIAEHDGALVEITAPATILATGGIGGLYAVTTTPAELKGEGLGLAALAGALIADPEFVQFHPTAIDIGRDPAPLAAPRDVVARAIHAERESGRGAFLDARDAVGDHFPDEFPAVFAACMSGGVDPRIQPIPVAPACHYHMGGIAADADGRTSLPGLYAAGECASTGVHGANRLASNSLLEAAVFGARTGRAAAQAAEPAPARLVRLLAPELPSEAVQILREAMSRDAGVIRTADGLLRLLDSIEVLEARHGRTAALAAARLVAASARARSESRGGHYRADATRTDAEPRRTFVRWSDLLPAANSWKYAAE